MIGTIQAKPNPEKPSPRERSSRRWVQLILGIGLSVGAMLLALRNASFAEIGDSLSAADLRWVPVMLALKVTTLVAKNLRWRCELAAMAPGRYVGTFRAIGLGYFGNLVLPFKLGELLRIGLLKRHNPGIAIGEALATIAAERALDGAVLAFMVAVVLRRGDVPGWVFTGTILLLVVMLSAIIVSTLTPVHRFFLDRLPVDGLLGVARRTIEALIRGTAVLRKPRAFATAASLTAIAWIGESLVFYCAIRSLGIPLGYSSTLVVTLLLSVGLLIPSAPGQIGTHQALAVLFLGAFGVGNALAISVSFVLQAITLTTLSTIGGYVVIREASLGELVRRSPMQKSQVENSN